MEDKQMKIIENIPYGTDSEMQRLDIYLPDMEAKTVFLYFHGGALEKGSKKSASFFAPYLCERKIAVVSADYRLYPEASYPDFINDAAIAVAFTKKYMDESLSCDRLYVGGSSAGGFLSMMLCFDKRYLTDVGLDNSAVAGYFHDAGQPTAHYKVLSHSGIDHRRIIVDETAPIYHVGLAEKYPPMRFIVSDNDMKGRYEQTMLMLSTLSHFGYEGFDHVVMHGKHCEYCKKYDENGESILGRLIYDFIEKVSKSSRSIGL
jgi:acetyl esterase/lipase